MAKKETVEVAEETGTEFSFPTLGVTVRASSLKEATEKAKSLISTI